MQNISLFLFFSLLLSYPSISFSKDWKSEVTDLRAIANQQILNYKTHYLERYQDPNKPAPELGRLIQSFRDMLDHNPHYQQRAKKDLAFRALWIQTRNHLIHASLTFERATSDYTHKDLFEGQYPLLPTLKAIEKAMDFLEFVEEKPEENLFERIAPNPERERALLAEQQRIAKDITVNSVQRYEAYLNLFKKQGPNVQFSDFESLVEYLILKLRSDAEMIERVTDIPLLRRFRTSVIRELSQVFDQGCPYRDTLDAIERVMEFYDVYHRAMDPARSPVLYHSGRYEYYLHYLKATAPDHILIPTLANLGATDLIRARGVPIGFAGVSTEIAYVDGYYQTPFEFYIHDINHARRMFLFFEKIAQKKRWSLLETAQYSDAFVKNTLIPLISIHPSDSEQTKNHKRLMKILLFEVLHEDALAAMPEVIQEAILRKAGVMTPFEEMREQKKVVYVMEPGASTLAYVFRKLFHDFYDLPGERMDYIVQPEYRTYEHILEAAVKLFDALDLNVDRKELESLLKQDTGFPQAFEEQLQRDILKRPVHQMPLISSERALKLAKEAFLRREGNVADIDDTRSFEILNFFRDANRINVHLKIPLKDERGSIEMLIPVPESMYGVNGGAGTADQIRADKRVIGIESGKHLDLNALKSEFLSRLGPNHYIVGVRSNDPQASVLINAAKTHGLDTILVTDISQSRISTEASPSFFVTLPKKSAANAYWKKLITNEDQKTASNLHLNFKRPLKLGYSQMIAEMESARLQARRKVEDQLIAKGVGIVELQDLEARICAEKTPIAILGASVLTWETLSDAEKQSIQQTIKRTLDALDPKKVLLITGGAQYGVEKIVHTEASLRGFAVVAMLPETANITEIGPVTHAAIVSKDWSGKSRPTFALVKKLKGMAVFIAGGKTLKNEITLAQQMDIDYFVMHGPKGAAHDVAAKNPARAFKYADDLLGKIFGKSPHLIIPSYQRSARDSLYASFAQKMESRGTKFFSFGDLIEFARGKKVVMLNGYVGLGYEHPESVRAALKEVMRREGEGTVYVGVGSHEGIGQVYDWIPEIARELKLSRVETAGIVSRNVANKGIAPMHAVHFVDNDVGNWRPMLGEADLQVQYLMATGGKLICFKGGEITGKVAKQALSSGLPVEILVGDSLDPNAAQVKAAQRVRLDTVLDGTSNLVQNRKQYRNLTVTRVSGGQPRTCAAVLNRAR